MQQGALWTLNRTRRPIGRDELFDNADAANEDPSYPIPYNDLSPENRTLFLRLWANLQLDEHRRANPIYRCSDQLPQELITRLLELGLEDWQDEDDYTIRSDYLWAASLVSKSWSAAASRLLWQDVVLVSKVMIDLCAASTALGKYTTRSLRIERPPNGDYQPHSVGRVIEGVSGLRTLAVHDFGRLSPLPLRSLTGTNLKDLKSLTVVDSRFEDTGVYNLAQPFNLDSFTYRQSTGCPFDHLLAFLKGQKLSHLDIQHNARLSASLDFIILDFFESVAPHLTSLILDAAFSDDRWSDNEIIPTIPTALISHFRYCTSLNHLELRGLDHHVGAAVRRLSAPLSSLTVDEDRGWALQKLFGTVAATKSLSTLTLITGHNRLSMASDDEACLLLEELEAKGIEVKFVSRWS